MTDFKEAWKHKMNIDGRTVWEKYQVEKGILEAISNGEEAVYINILASEKQCFEYICKDLGLTCIYENDSEKDNKKYCLFSVKGWTND